jgi:ribosomal protein S18 acetylase RimI-like enzyme
MPAVSVRDAAASDAHALVPLLDALGYPVDPATIRDQLRLLPEQDPSGRVLLAVVADRVVGFLTLHVTPALHRPTPVGRITALSVLPADRGAGAGRALVRAAEAHFQGLGLARAEVTSGPTHEAAYAFYRHLGYADQGVRFARQL